MDEAALELPPLPAALRAGVLRALPAGVTIAPTSNPGLVFERYPRCWDVRDGAWDLGPGRRRFLADLAAGHRDLEPTCGRLLAARVDALASVLGRGREFTSSSRFVTGVGAEHPLENGFTFHHLFGVPYVPGSSVKGLVRAVARLQGIDEDDERRLFGAIRGAAPAAALAGFDPGASAGADAHAEAGSAGGLVFFDGLPVSWPRLGVDLINNHHPTWTTLLNAGGTDVDAAAAASAAGLEDPVPVFFLVVEPGLCLRFWILRRPGSDLGAKELDLAWSWLELGLRHLGIGARTAVGYGRFRSGAGGVAPGTARPPEGTTAAARPGSDGDGGSGGTRPRHPTTAPSAARRRAATPTPSRPRPPAPIASPDWAQGVRAIRLEDAGAQVPSLLASLGSGDRKRAAIELVKNLGRRKLLARLDEPWARDLLEVADLL